MDKLRVSASSDSKGVAASMMGECSGSKVLVRKEEEQVTSTSKCSTSNEVVCKKEALRHNVNIFCYNCRCDEDYIGENLHSMVVRVPYCCDSSNIVALVSATYTRHWTPYRGVRYEIWEEESHDGELLDYNDRTYIREYYIASPMYNGLEVYFVSQLGRPDEEGRLPNLTRALEVNSLESWRETTTNAEILLKPWEAVYMNHHPSILPTFVPITR